MARPKRHNADYFSHDSGMRDDPKIKALRNKFGITGYAVWCMMLEILTNSDHFKRSVDDIEIEILSADFGIDAELFSDILSYMLRLRLLQTGDSGEYLSQKLTDRLQPVVDKRRNSGNKGVSVTESTQSKGKETKVNKRKEENIKTKQKTENELDIFDRFRKAYPGTKNGNQTEFANFQKKHKDWKFVLNDLSSLLDCIINQRALAKYPGSFVPQWKNLSTWINNRCWEEETGKEEVKTTIGKGSKWT